MRELIIDAAVRDILTMDRIRQIDDYESIPDIGYDLLSYDYMQITYREAHQIRQKYRLYALMVPIECPFYEVET